MNSLRLFKQTLTLVGALLSQRRLVQIQALVNYFAVGAWMRDRGYSSVNRVKGREEVWAAMSQGTAEHPVLYLEFGVAKGRSINYWSHTLKHPAAILHGFDSFEGLPEASGPWAKGQFATDGLVPTIDDGRVRSFKGWFDQVLPMYRAPFHERLIINIDADLYSSTIYVLRTLKI